MNPYAIEHIYTIEKSYFCNLHANIHMDQTCFILKRLSDGAILYRACEESAVRSELSRRRRIRSAQKKRLLKLLKEK
jgi:hypothetical protein